LSCERALASLPAAYCGRSARAGPTSAAVSRTTTVGASCGSLEDRLRCNSLLAGIPGPNTQAVRGSYHAVVPSLVTSSDGQCLPRGSTLTATSSDRGTTSSGFSVSAGIRAG